jgi:hypothetical protein
MEVNKKRMKVHMVHTKKESYIGVCIKKMRDRAIGDVQHFNSPMLMSLEYWQPHHLYYTSDDEIKEGDWVLGKHGPTKNWNAIEGFTSQYRKIEVSTDPKLTDKCDGCKRAKDSDTIYTCSCGVSRVAQPTQAFIEAYCKQGGIDRVLVEYESDHKKVERPKGVHPKGVHITITPNFKLKVDPIHGTVVTHRIVEKTYTEKEHDYNIMMAVALFAAEQGLTPTSDKMKVVNEWAKKHCKNL